jgi:PAS domain S-box-containing protein
MVNCFETLSRFNPVRYIRHLFCPRHCNVFSHDSSDIDIAFQYKDIFNHNYCISKTDIAGVITYANAEFLRVYNLTLGEVIGKTHAIIKDNDTDPIIYKDMWRTISSGKIWKGNISYKTKFNETKWSVLSIFPIIKNNKIFEFLALRQDITELIDLRQEIEESQRELIINLSSIIEGKDTDLKHHVARVAEYSYILARAYGLSEERSKLIKYAAPMHDAGKIGIDDNILHAPRKLTIDEFEIMKDHTKLGHDIFKHSELSVLKTAGLISYHHHEKWNGTGYPNKLKEESISIEGRVVAIADVYDALSSIRPYKNAWLESEIDTYFKEESGVSFDPDLIELYFNNKYKFEQIKETIK